MGISESEKVILDWLAQQYDAMVALLAETVSIDSGSYNKKGVDAVGRLFRDHLSKAGIACEVIPRADHLPFALDGGTHAFIRDAQGDDAFPGRRGLPRILHLPARESMPAEAGTRLVARNFRIVIEEESTCLHRIRGKHFAP